MQILSIQHLVDAINHWCEEHRILPVNGQTSQKLTERNVRYYRTRNLLDPPGDGAHGLLKRGFHEKHIAQLKAIRLLQARGLPLSYIEQKICGKSLDELEALECQELALTEPTRVNVSSGVIPFSSSNPGLNQSKFENETGLSTSHFSSFRDISSNQATQSLSPEISSTHKTHENWLVSALGEDFLLISKRGVQISEDQRRILSAMLNACTAESSIKAA